MNFVNIELIYGWWFLVLLIKFYNFFTFGKELLLLNAHYFSIILFYLN